MYIIPKKQLKFCTFLTSKDFKDFENDYLSIYFHFKTDQHYCWKNRSLTIYFDEIEHSGIKLYNIIT